MEEGRRAGSIRSRLLTPTPAAAVVAVAETVTSGSRWTGPSKGCLVVGVIPLWVGVLGGEGPRSSLV